MNCSKGKASYPLQSSWGLGQLVPDASRSRPWVHGKPLQNLILSLRVWLLVLQASLDAVQLQPESRLLGRELHEMSWERLHHGLTLSLGSCLCSSPHPGSLSEWSCSYVWPRPCALLVPTWWFEFWLDCGPISSYRHIWRPGLLAGPGYDPGTSSTRLALPCLASPIGSSAPGWPCLAEKTHFGSSPTYPLWQDTTATLCLKQGMHHFRGDSATI